MTLENELKKNTAALEANTAALTGGTNALAPQTPATQPTATPGLSPASAGPPPIPNAAPPIPGAVLPGAAAIPTQPGAVVPPVTQPITHAQAQAELGAIVQALGDGTQVQATMMQYGSARLNEIPAENLFSLVQACKLLLTA